MVVVILNSMSHSHLTVRVCFPFFQELHGENVIIHGGDTTPVYVSREIVDLMPDHRHKQTNHLTVCVYGWTAISSLYNIEIQIYFLKFKSIFNELVD